MFGFTLCSASTVYFLAEFVIRLIFIFAKSGSYKAAFLVQIIIAGIYAVSLILNMIANESTANSAAQRETEAAYISRFQL